MEQIAEGIKLSKSQIKKIKFLDNTLNREIGFIPMVQVINVKSTKLVYDKGPKWKKIDELEISVYFPEWTNIGRFDATLKGFLENYISCTNRIVNFFQDIG